MQAALNLPANVSTAVAAVSSLPANVTGAATLPASITAAVSSLPANVTGAATLPASIPNAASLLPANGTGAIAALAQGAQALKKPGSTILSDAMDAVSFVETTSSTPSSCLDVTNTTDVYCYGNVTWAMLTGINEQPDWYTEYPILSVSQAFQAYQYVLADKVGPGPFKPDGNGWNCPYPCGLEIPTCAEISSVSPGQCYKNVMWAKQTGLVEHPEWYSLFPGLTVNSSLSDFQFVLHTKVGPGNGTGWQCPMPCASSFIASTTSSTTVGTSSTVGKDLFATSSTAIPTTTSTTLAAVGAADSSEFPWWGWLLGVIGCLLCVVLAGALYLKFCKDGGKPKKTKRAATVEKTSAPARAPPVIAAPAPGVETTIAPPVYSRAAAVAPAQYVAAPSTYVAAAPPAVPVVTTAVPMASYAAQAQQAAALFDALDTNHDGTITRAEFARLAQIR